MMNLVYSERFLRHISKNLPAGNLREFHFGGIFCL